MRRGRFGTCPYRDVHRLSKCGRVVVEGRVLAVREVTLGDDGIRILWDDGHSSFYLHRYLRGRCCCAACVDEMTGRRRVAEEDVGEDIQALDWMQIGRYAVQFLWSDSHDSGIYPFDLLRRLCRCDECAGGWEDG